MATRKKKSSKTTKKKASKTSKKKAASAARMAPSASAALLTAGPTANIDASMNSDRLVTLAQYAITQGEAFRDKLRHKHLFQERLLAEYGAYSDFTSTEIAACIGFADTFKRKHGRNDEELVKALQDIVDDPPSSG